MASVAFRIRSKANKNVAIKVYVSNGRNNLVEINTGFTINPTDWSEATKLPKQNTPENKILYKKLKKLESFVFDSLNESSTVDEVWLNDVIDKCFDRVKRNDTGLLINHIQHIIDNASTRKIKGRKKLGISESRVKSYKTFKVIIEEYEKAVKKPINLLDINKPFVDRFTRWLLNDKVYSTNYAGKQIDNLKTVCIDAIKCEIPTNPYAPQIESFSEADEDRYIVTLSFDELKKVQEADLKNESLKNARNWILLGCEIGQRGNDLLSITKDNVRYKGKAIYIDLVQEKGNKHVTVPVIAPHVIDIIENEFPHRISTQKLNKYIKKVCEKAGITELTEGRKLKKETKRKELGLYPKHDLVSTHSFRRSFATNYYKKIPTPILMNITGHEKESTFLIYINKREDKDANADLFAKFYEQINKDIKEPQLKVI